jgi:hypothetical protein
MFLIERLPAVETDLDRIAHQVALADGLGTGMGNNRQRNVVASIKRQA